MGLIFNTYQNEIDVDESIIIYSNFPFDKIFLDNVYVKYFDGETFKNFKKDEDFKCYPLRFIDLENKIIDKFEIKFNSSLPYNTEILVILKEIVSTNLFGNQKIEFLEGTQILRFLTTYKNKYRNYNDILFQINHLDKILDPELHFLSQDYYNLFLENPEKNTNELIFVDNNQNIKNLFLKQFLIEYDNFIKDFEYKDKLNRYSLLITDNELKKITNFIFKNINFFNSLKGNKKILEFILGIYCRILGYNLLSVIEDNKNFIYRITSSLPKEYWNRSIQKIVHPLGWRIIYNEMNSSVNNNSINFETLGTFLGFKNLINRFNLGVISFLDAEYLKYTVPLYKIIYNFFHTNGNIELETYYEHFLKGHRNCHFRKEQDWFKFNLKTGSSLNPSIIEYFDDKNLIDKLFYRKDNYRLYINRFLNKFDIEFKSGIFNTYYDKIYRQNELVKTIQNGKSRFIFDLNRQGSDLVKDDLFKPDEKFYFIKRIERTDNDSRDSKRKTWATEYFQYDDSFLDNYKDRHLRYSLNHDKFKANDLDVSFTAKTEQINYLKTFNEEVVESNLVQSWVAGPHLIFFIYNGLGIGEEKNSTFPAGSTIGYQYQRQRLIENVVSLGAQPFLSQSDVAGDGTPSDFITAGGYSVNFLNNAYKWNDISNIALPNILFSRKGAYLAGNPNLATLSNGQPVYDVTEQFNGISWSEKSRCIFSSSNGGGGNDGANTFIIGTGKRSDNEFYANCARYDYDVWSTISSCLTKKGYPGSSGKTNLCRIFCDYDFNYSEEFNGISWKFFEKPIIQRQNVAGNGRDTTVLSGGKQGAGVYSLIEFYKKNKIKNFVFNKFNYCYYWKTDINLPEGIAFSAGCGNNQESFIFGGKNSNNYITNSYLIKNASVITKERTLTQRSNNSGCGFVNSISLCLGGENNSQTLNSVESYQVNSWNTLPGMLTPREKFGSCGDFYDCLAIGGLNNGTLLNTTEKFNGTSWQMSANLVNSTSNHSTCGTPNTALLFSGKILENGNIVSTYKNYRFNGINWYSVNNSISARADLACAGDGWIGVIFGGISYLNTSETFNGSDFRAGSNLNQGRESHIGLGNFDTCFCVGGLPFTSSTEKFVLAENMNEDEYFNLLNSTWKLNSFLCERTDAHAGCGTASETLIYGGGIYEPVNWTILFKDITQYFNNISWSYKSPLPKRIFFAGGAGTPNNAYSVAGDDTNYIDNFYKFNNVSWSNFGTYPVKASRIGCCGENNILGFGGTSGTTLNKTYEFNGVSWVNRSNMLISVYSMGSCGNPTEALSFGGSLNSSTKTKNIYRYNSVNWNLENYLDIEKEFIGTAGDPIKNLLMGGNSSTSNKFNTSFYYNRSSLIRTSNLLTPVTFGVGTGNTTDALYSGGSDNEKNILCYAQRFNTNEKEYLISAWKYISSLNNLRGYHASCGTYQDILVSGGSSGSFCQPSEFFNEMTWINQPGILDPRELLSSCGNFFNGIVAGGSKNLSYLKNVEYFNGINWSTYLDLPRAVNQLGCIGNHLEFLSIGGKDSNSIYNSVDLFNGSSWISKPNLITPRCGFGHSGLINEAFVFGGIRNTSFVKTQTSEYFNGISWISYPDLVDYAVFQIKGTGTLNDTLAFSGISDFYSKEKHTRFFNGISWYFSSYLNEGRSYSSGSGIGSENSFAIGGSIVSSVENYKKTPKPINILTSQTFSNLLSPRYLLGSCGTIDDSVALGGKNLNNHLGNAEVFNGNNWSVLTNLSNFKSNLSACGNSSSNFILAGGLLSDEITYLNTVEEFNGLNLIAKPNMINNRADFGLCGNPLNSLACYGISPSFVIPSEKYDGISWTSVSNVLENKKGVGICGVPDASLTNCGENDVNIKVNTSHIFNGLFWSIGSNPLIKRSHVRENGNVSNTVILGGLLQNYQTINFTEYFNNFNWKMGNFLLSPRSMMGSTGNLNVDSFIFGGKNQENLLTNSEKIVSTLTAEDLKNSFYTLSSEIYSIPTTALIKMDSIVLNNLKDNYLGFSTRSSLYEYTLEGKAIPENNEYLFWNPNFTNSYMYNNLIFELNNIDLFKGRVLERSDHYIVNLIYLNPGLFEEYIWNIHPEDFNLPGYEIITGGSILKFNVPKYHPTLYVELTLRSKNFSTILEYIFVVENNIVYITHIQDLISNGDEELPW